MPHVWPVRTADVVHFSDIVAAKVRLSEYQFLVFPGGFLDGDDLGAAQAAAQRWLHLSDAEGQPLLDSLNRFADAGASCWESATDSSCSSSSAYSRVGREAF